MPFFSDTNQANRCFNLWQDSGANHATFIQEKRQLNATRLKMLGNGFGAIDARNFFVMTKGKVNGALRFKTFTQEVVDRFEDANDGQLGVQRAASPNIAICQRATKRWVGPG